MAYTLTIDHPNLPKGAEVEIPGLGLFKNRSTTTLTDEQVETFRQLHGTIDDEGNWQLGDTPLQASKNTEGVTVETVSDDKKGDS